jgi:uncharacterized protein (DUF1501 family)
MTTPCPEFHTASRRGFLRGSLALGATAAITATHGSVFTQTAYAAAPTDRTLVVLSMRGAVDGMSLVVPHADPNYYPARPNIKVPLDQLLVRDAMFGLHPSLAPLLPLWNNGKMATIQATGLPVANRSHFAAMEELEDADPGSAARVGWLNRLVGRNGTPTGVEAIQFGRGIPNMAVSGPNPVLVASNVESVRLPGAYEHNEASRRSALTTAWAPWKDELATGFTAALNVVTDFAPVHETPKTPANAASYPNGDLGSALAAAARTIRADVGAEIITVDHGSWDHHTYLGSSTNGTFKRLTDDLAGSIAAFYQDLGALGDNVTLVTISEFGRRVVENANQGLDHGYGTVMMAFGGGVRGGYYGTWPGLTRTSDADLLVTTDYRSVLNEIITTRMGASTAQIFPGFVPTTTGFMTSL